jgi:hypothetical protein
MKSYPAFLRNWLGVVGKILLAAVFTTWTPRSAQAGPLDLGTPISHTPYDQYLGPVWEVMHRLGANQPDPAEVEKLVREGRSFRYSYNSNQPFVPQTPEQTESTKCGDCKAKALWLASKMDSRNVRFVIGKAGAQPGVSHAWLIWEGPQGWLILDATMYSRPLQPDRLSPTDYLPRFSYSPTGKFAHAYAAAAHPAKYGDHL